MYCLSARPLDGILHGWICYVCQTPPSAPIEDGKIEMEFWSPRDWERPRLSGRVASSGFRTDAAVTCANSGLHIRHSAQMLIIMAGDKENERE